MSPDSMRVCRKDTTVVLGVAPSPPSSTCSWDSWAPLGIRPLVRALHLHNRYTTGSPQGWEHQQLRQEMGSERASVVVIWGHLDTLQPGF